MTAEVAAVALLPCEKRCEKKSPQRYLRGMRVVVVILLRCKWSLSSCMDVIIDDVDVV